MGRIVKILDFIVFRAKSKLNIFRCFIFPCLYQLVSFSTAFVKV